MAPDSGLAVASGHAAQLIAFHTLMQPGMEIIAARQLYGGSVNQLKAVFRKQRARFLQEQALLQITEGETSVQEMIRVLRAEEGGAAPQAGTGGGGGAPRSPAGGRPPARKTG